MHVSFNLYPLYVNHIYLKHPILPVMGGYLWFVVGDDLDIRREKEELIGG